MRSALLSIDLLLPYPLIDALPVDMWIYGNEPDLDLPGEFYFACIVAAFASATIIRCTFRAFTERMSAPREAHLCI